MSITLIGVPGPRRIGAPFFGYILLMLFGWITLSIPVLVKFEVEEESVMNLEEIKEFIIPLVNRDLDNYENNILSRIRAAKNVQSIVSIFIRD